MADPFAVPAVVRLRRCATLVVALALAAAGARDALHPDPPTQTMIGRYLDTPRARRAGGCMEAALALWLVSGRNPRLAPLVCGAAVLTLGAIAGAELRRERPLPSGLAVTPAEALATPAAKLELSVTVAREAFLLTLCVLAASLAPDEETETPAAGFERYA